MAINFLNTVAVDDSVLFVDTINDRVGIGTDSPTNGKLVIDSTANQIAVETGTAGDGRLNIGHFSNGTFIGTYGDDGGAADLIRFGTHSGDERMRITSAGSVGIGITSPVEKLHVSGSVNNDDIGIRISNTFDDNDSASEPNAVLFLNAASNNGYLRVHGAPANTASKHQVDLGSTAGSSFLTFSPSGAERMRITSTGNVGIGTSSPYDSSWGANSKQLTISGTDYGVLNLIDAGGPTKFAIGAGDGKLYLAYDDVASEHRIVVDSVGNVGIGTTSPSQKLDVEGNVKIKDVLLSNQEELDASTGANVIANVAIATYTAAFFDYVIKKSTNVRSGTVYACHDGTNVEFTETSTNDLGDTSDVALSVDISGANMRLIATTTSDEWLIKSLVKAI